MFNIPSHQGNRNQVVVFAYTGHSVTFKLLWKAFPSLKAPLRLHHLVRVKHGALNTILSISSVHIHSLRMRLTYISLYLLQESTEVSFMGSSHEAFLKKSQQEPDIDASSEALPESY